jgi:hypothetical protein
VDKFLIALNYSSNKEETQFNTKTYLPSSILAICSVSSSTLITLDPRNQSLAQISRSTIVGVSELLKSSSVLPLALKADSDATVEIGTTNHVIGSPVGYVLAQRDEPAHAHAAQLIFSAPACMRGDAGRRRLC